MPPFLTRGQHETFNFINNRRIDLGSSYGHMASRCFSTNERWDQRFSTLHNVNTITNNLKWGDGLPTSANNNKGNNNNEIIKKSRYRIIQQNLLHIFKRELSVHLGPTRQEVLHKV